MTDFIIRDQIDRLAANMEQLISVLTEHAEQLIASRLVCVACAAEAHAKNDTDANVNVANIIAAGNSVCYNHVQFTDRPIMPGQTPSGLYLAGQTS